MLQSLENISCKRLKIFYMFVLHVEIASIFGCVTTSKWYYLEPHDSLSFYINTVTKITTEKQKIITFLPYLACS